MSDATEGTSTEVKSSMFGFKKTKIVGNKGNRKRKTKSESSGEIQYTEYKQLIFMKDFIFI